MNHQNLVITETDRFIKSLDELFEIPPKQKHFISGYLSAWLESALRVQRTAEGSGPFVWLGNVFIRFGWWLAKFGSR